MIRHRIEHQARNLLPQKYAKNTKENFCAFCAFLRLNSLTRLGGLILLFSLAIVAQVPMPRSVLGFDPADDRTIADWTQITGYFKKLDDASNRVAIKEIGKTTVGKPMIVAFISSPENIKNLDRLRQISAKLADPRTVKDDVELESLIKS